MSNESHNNTGSWRSKLEALESLPGKTVVDKNTSWENLHDRLRTKKGQRKMIWYWSAAACLLLLLMIPAIKSNKNDHEAAKNETVQKRPTKSSPTVLIEKRDSAQIESPKPFEGHQAATAKNKNPTRYQIAAPAKETKLLRLADDVSNAAPAKETINPPLKTLDTSLNVAAVSVNKKLKVVHINELGDPVEETPGIARSADIHSFQLKLANQEVYVNSSLASRTSGFTILKSKISPN